MLAARDQENLVHGHQTAAANKPLNRGLTPKTPGQKFPKTPLKLALNDENAGVVAGKATLRKRTRNQNENAPPAVGKGGEKNAFVTPGPAARTQRAPLGFKTTNAKARAFQTPAPAPAPTVQHENRPQPTSVSARKQRAKISHGKLNVFGDQESNDLEEREIEYCPPTPKDLPDIPDDITPLSPEILAEIHRIATENPIYAAMQTPDWQGLTIADRAERRQEREFAIQRRKEDAWLQYDCDCLMLPCLHNPECGDFDSDCIDNIENRKVAEEKLKKTLQSIDDEVNNNPWKAAVKEFGEFVRNGPAGMSSTSTSKPKPSTASTIVKPKLSPTSVRSSRPASQPGSGPKRSAAKSYLRDTITSQTKSSRPTPKPLTQRNPSTTVQQHKAAVVISKNTLGYAKGRSTATVLRDNRATTQPSTLKSSSSSSSAPTSSKQSKAPQPRDSATTTTKRPSKKGEREKEGKEQELTPYQQFFHMDPEDWLAKFGKPRPESHLWGRLWRMGYFREEDDEVANQVEGDEEGGDDNDEEEEEEQEEFVLVLQD